MVFDIGPTEPPAKAVFRYAEEYLRSAKYLIENKSEENLMFLPPCNFLLSHAFELFCKSYLKYMGLSYTDLKTITKTGHGALALIKKCDEIGLEIESTFYELAEVIDNLNVSNIQRYPMLGLFTLGPQGMCEPRNLLMYITKFSEQVREILYNDRNQKSLRRG